MAFDDRAAARSSKIRLGMSVTLRDLKSAAHLNGLIGRVLHLDEATQRWQVDIGKGDGVKALRPENLVPCFDDDAGEEEDKDESGGSDAGVALFKNAAPGDLIRKLLQGRGQSDAEDDNELPAEDRSEDWFAEGVGEESNRQEDESGQYDPEEDPAQHAERDQEGGLRGSNHQIGSHRDGLSDIDDQGEAGAEAQVPPGKHHQGTTNDGNHDFSSFAVRDLKAFLAARGVGIPAGIAEKGELITLCERASNMPVRHMQPQAQKPVTPTTNVPDDGGGSNSNASPRRSRRRRNRAEATRSKAAPESRVPQPPRPTASSSFDKSPHGSGYGGHAGHHDGLWDHGRRDPMMPPPYGGPWNYGVTPPPPDMAWHGYGGFPPMPMHPGHMPPGPGYGPPGGYGPPPGYGPVAAGPPPPRSHQPQSREEAVARAEERLRYRRPAEETVAVINRFVQDYNLCDEVDLGLRMLRVDQVRHLTSSKTVARLLRDAGDANEVVLAELHVNDPEAAGIVQALRSGSRQDRSRGGRRERRRERERDRERERERERERCVHAFSAGDDGIHRRSRSGRRRRRQPSEPVERPRRREACTRQKAAPSAPPAVRPGGVWAAGAQHGANGGGHDMGRNHGGSSGSQEKEMEAWLLSLDGSHGALLPYLGPLCREFGELQAVAAALAAKPSTSSVVGKIDPSLWATLGVESLGHRLLLAKGIVALAKSNS